MTDSAPSKSEIRTLLWDMTCLGSTLHSADDDRLDDTDLGLDSVNLLWLIGQLERRTGRPVTDGASIATFQTVNTIQRQVAASGH
jgi:acyl carrier protein